MFPNGAGDLVLHFIAQCNSQLTEILAEEHNQVQLGQAEYVCTRHTCLIYVFAARPEACMKGKALILCRKMRFKYSMWVLMFLDKKKQISTNEIIH